MDGKPERGVLYMASRKDLYVEEGFLSAASVRARHPELPITMATDRPHHPLLDVGIVTDVVPIEAETAYLKGAQIDRIRALLGSPYRRTLHLDTDTRVRAPSLAPVFDALAEVDILQAEAVIDRSISRTEVGRPMFNNGVIAFRDSPPVRALLAEWLALTERNFARATNEEAPEHPMLGHIADPEKRRQLLLLDQMAMVEIFSPEVNKHELSYAILGEVWNFRGEVGKRRVFGGPMIDHQPGLRNRLWFDMLLVARGLWVQGNEEAASKVYRHVMRRKLTALEAAPRQHLLAELKADLASPPSPAMVEVLGRLAVPGGLPPDLDERLRAAVMHAKIGQKDEAFAICREAAGAAAPVGPAPIPSGAKLR